MPAEPPESPETSLSRKRKNEKYFKKDDVNLMED